MQDFSEKASQNVIKFCSDYKVHIISGFFLILLALYSQTRYTTYRQDMALAAAEHYYTYTQAAERDDTATQQRALEMLKTQSPDESFTDLARIHEIASLIDNKDWDAAERELLGLEKSTKIEMFQTIARYKRAEIYYVQERFDEALATIESLEHPDFYLKQHLQARIYAASGQKERALEIFEQLLALPNLDKPVQASWAAQYQALALEENLA